MNILIIIKTCDKTQSFAQTFFSLIVVCNTDGDKVPQCVLILRGYNSIFHYDGAWDTIYPLSLFIKGTNTFYARRFLSLFFSFLLRIFYTCLSVILCMYYVCVGGVRVYVFLLQLKLYSN